MGILVPGSVAESIVRDRDKRQASEFDKRLEAIDYRLFCFKAYADASDYGIRNGFWYIVRANDDSTFTFLEVHDDGAYAEPNERVLDALRKSDSWSRDVWRDMERDREQRDERRRADLGRRRLEMREQLQEIVDFEFRVQIPAGKDGLGLSTGKRRR